MKTIRCKTCWNENPAEIHTCTPWFYFIEHEQLKWICDEIGYNYYYNTLLNTFKEKQSDWGYIDTSIRDIIFTSIFRECLISHLESKWYNLTKIGKIIQELVWQLDNPVQYLYNLLQWKQ